MALVADMIRRRIIVGRFKVKDNNWEESEQSIYLSTYKTLNDYFQQTENSLRTQYYKFG